MVMMTTDERGAEKAWRAVRLGAALGLKASMVQSARSVSPTRCYSRHWRPLNLSIQIENFLGRSLYRERLDEPRSTLLAQFRELTPIVCELLKCSG